MPNQIKGYPKVRMAQDADTYVRVPVTCNAVLGPTGNTGDYLDTVLAIVNNASVSSVELIDGVNNFTLLPNNVGAGVGTYPIPVGLSSMNGAWRIVTNNGVSVVASGIFTR